MIEHKPNELITLEDGRKVAIDRSVGVVLLVTWTDPEDNYRYVLINRRGSTTSEYKNYWNLPSGYLDWGETGEEAAVRECWEECGVKIDPSKVEEIEHSTSPKENRQNVIFRYRCVLEEPPEINEECRDKIEATEVVFAKIIELEEYDFAWEQRETIKRLLEK